MKRDPFPVLLTLEERQILNHGRTLSGADSLGAFIRDAALKETKRLNRAANRADSHTPPPVGRGQES